jgi:hemoglobin
MLDRVSDAATPTDFERIGEARLRALMVDFVGRVRSDVMIGFLFARVEPGRLAELEAQHAAAHLGGPARYEGRPLKEAHARHRILGGQFARRREILRQTLAAHGVPEDVARRWLAHVDSLRGEITADLGSECR